MAIPSLRYIDRLFSTDYISGLNIVISSATQVYCTSGAAYVPGLGRILYLDQASLLYTVPGIAPNTTYHVYYYDAAPRPGLDISTVIPTTYNTGGMGRVKQTLPTRRYLGSLRTDSSGNLLPYVFSGDGNLVKVLPAYNSGVPVTTTGGRVINSNNALGNQDVDLSTRLYGPTAVSATLRVANGGTGDLSRIHGHNPITGTYDIFANASPGQIGTYEVPIDSGKTQFSNSGPAANSFIDLLGFTYVR